LPTPQGIAKLCLPIFGKELKMTLLRITLIAAAAFVFGCGPRAFVKGNYDENVEDTNLLTDRWSETDMQKAVQDLVKEAVANPTIAAAKRRPIVMVTRLQNKTSEVIDTQNITDMFQVELQNSGKVQFVDKAAREDMAEEYEYQDSGMVSRETKKGKGGQVGADFVLNGRLDSIVQEAGKDKTVYYKMTMNLTNLKSGLVEWTGQKQMRKMFKKKRIGL
jgi:penicillin-binding protein activator